jgi:poly-gamma-glutamate synthesis protein (capsule biosynthesis protein)
VKKITFLGDIMCEKPFLKAAIKRNNDFYSAFACLQEMLSESDFVVGNLETPIAGKELGYTKDLYAFNTPSEFLDGLKKLKIDLYLTANNHCLDRGVKGLENTLGELDKRKMPHTGTARSQEEQLNIFIKELGDTSCAFLSYNAYINEDKWLKYKDEICKYNVNGLIDNDLLIKYRETHRAKTIAFYKTRKLIGSLLPKNIDIYVKGKLGYKFSPYVDNEPLSEIEGDYLENVKYEIKLAKQKADLVFIFPHCGGQFNEKPGIRSKELFEKLVEYGADAVLASHPHVIQCVKSINGKPCAYSLGNVSMSISSPYLVKEALPQYGMIFHTYIENKKIVKTSFSLIKIIEEKDNYPIVIPVDELYQKYDGEKQELLEKEIKQLYSRVTGKNSFPGVKREYELLTT